MKPTKLDILKSYFSSDKYSYWWDKFSDYELQLSRMSLTELASELNRTKVRNETENIIIVEHILAARLSRLQSRASWWAGWLSFAGAMLAVLLTFYLGRCSAYTDIRTESISQPSTITHERAIEKSIPAVIPSFTDERPNGEAINTHKDKAEDKQ